MLSLKVGFMAFSISYFLAEVQLTGIPAFPAPDCRDHGVWCVISGQPPAPGEFAVTQPVGTDSCVGFQAS